MTDDTLAASIGGLGDPASSAIADASVFPIAAAAVLVFSVVLVACAVALAFLALTETSDQSGRFERCYATVNARVAEGSFWLFRHLRWAAARDNVEARLGVAGWTLIILAANVLVPVCAIYAGQRQELQQHGIALAIGALVWGCVLEGATLPTRIRALAGRPLIDIRVWQVAVLLLIGDISVGVIAAVNYLPAELNAAVAGGWFVALADIVSMATGFILCPWEPYFLSQPDQAAPQ